MRGVKAACIAILAFWASALCAEPFGLEQPQDIQIGLDFDGATLEVAGRYDSTADAPQIAIFVVGPGSAQLVRKKGQRWGMWLNTDQRLAKDAPGFHAVGLSSPSLQGAAKASPYALDRLFPLEGDEFRKALVRLRTDQGLFGGAARVEAEAGRFSATFSLPDTVIGGEYAVHALLLAADGRPQEASASFSVGKSGWAQFVDSFDHANPFGYALALLAIALLWGALAYLAPIAFKQYAIDFFFDDDEASAGKG